jgi:hypothetical protein
VPTGKGDSVKIVGVCIAHDESPTMLGPAVAGFARFCDAIVYCEGAYAFYPRARARSNPDESHTVIGVCEAMGVELIVHRPSDVYWGNEVEKRNRSLRIASGLDPDWIVIFDADYHIIRCNPERIREELEATDLHCGTYLLMDGMDTLAKADSFVKSVQTNDIAHEWVTRTKDIYRWTPDLRYGPAHFTVRGTYDGENHWVRGPEIVMGQEEKASPPIDLMGNLLVQHRREYRSKIRKDAATEYYKTREATRIEEITAESIEAYA